MWRNFQKAVIAPLFTGYMRDGHAGPAPDSDGRVASGRRAPDTETGSIDVNAGPVVREVGSVVVNICSTDCDSLCQKWEQVQKMELLDGITEGKIECVRT